MSYVSKTKKRKKKIFFFLWHSLFKICRQTIIKKKKGRQPYILIITLDKNLYTLRI